MWLEVTRSVQTDISLSPRLGQVTPLASLILILLWTAIKKKACVLIAALSAKRRLKRKRWAKEWLLKRDVYTHLNLVREIRGTEDEDYENYYRMKDACFDSLLVMVKPFLTKQDTCMRKAISAEEKLAVTLRFLATGRNMKDLRFSAIMPTAAIGQAIMDTCEALLYSLQSHIQMPTTEEEWEKISSDFGEKYRFWNAIGALDGKHVAIQKPAHSGALYHNYKGYFIIVLMALANSNKEFIMIDVGANGRISDGGVLFYTKFWEKFTKGELIIPDWSPLPNTNETFPYVFLSDEAFALSINLMKPFPQSACTANQSTFNYRLSRARSVVEGAFGILRSKFGIFQKAICFEPKKAATIVATCCYLHNYLLKTQPRLYMASNWRITAPDEVIDLSDLQPSGNRNSSKDAKSVRE